VALGRWVRVAIGIGAKMGARPGSSAIIGDGGFQTSFKLLASPSSRSRSQHAIKRLIWMVRQRQTRLQRKYSEVEISGPDFAVSPRYMRPDRVTRPRRRFRDRASRSDQPVLTILLSSRGKRSPDVPSGKSTRHDA